jgi:hypothetical protein
MASLSRYFSRAPVQGVGKMHFLMVPKVAGPGSIAETLLGSLVAEYDRGLFSLSEVPGDEHVWKKGYGLTAFAQATSLAGEELVVDQELAAVTQSLKIERKFKLGAGAPLPGVPATGSINVDYSRLRSVEFTLGAGSIKRYIPSGFIKAGYDWCQSHSSQVDRQLFDDDYMLVDQLLLVKSMALKVVSDTEFSAGFKAQAAEISDGNIGVNYDVTRDREVTVKVDDGRTYLFALAAVQLENIKR